MAFVAGYVLLLIAFGVLPTCYAIYFAFTDAGGAFTGFSNFITTAQDFRFVDSLGHVALYMVFWLLSLVVRDIPVSTAYAVWAGAGTALVAVVGVVWLGEDWNWITVTSLAMIIIGVVALNLSGAH